MTASRDLIQKVSIMQAKRQPFIRWEREQFAIAMLKAVVNANYKADCVKQGGPTH
ncbi:hypothetical protein AB0Y04_04875 [Loigolactobacillus coryniformis]|uniref:hypothetical protein n=1 Tax=Loigolactobacillus coryniformis TaxID=1610 RepID=UPI003F29DBBC